MRFDLTEEQYQALTPHEKAVVEGLILQQRERPQAPVSPEEGLYRPIKSETAAEMEARVRAAMYPGADPNRPIDR